MHDNGMSVSLCLLIGFFQFGCVSNDIMYSRYFSESEESSLVLEYLDFGKSIVIPEFIVDDMLLTEAIEELVEKSSIYSESQVGISIMFWRKGDKSKPLVSLSLYDKDFYQVLDALCVAANYHWTVTDDGLIVTRLIEDTPDPTFIPEPFR